MKCNVTLLRRKAQRSGAAVPLTKQLFLCFIGSLLSFCCYSQQKGTAEKISLHLQRVSLSRVLDEIDKQTAYSFSYLKDDFDKITIHEYRVENASLTEALNLLKKKAGIEFTISGNAIIFRIAERLPAPSKKQSLTGKLTGKIIDEADGQPLVGATIRVNNTSAITDMEGIFTVELSNGVHSALVSFVGYGTKEISDIMVKNDELLTLNITMKREKGSLSAVVVRTSAKKETVASLYARQKNAAGFTDGISAEQIGRTPDKNIGESLKRISGLSTVDNKFVVVRGLNERYNQALLNGQLLPSTELNRKQFSFDIIPVNMVDNVTVIKTITPDQSAEFGGGLVQINTKAIPTGNFFQVSGGMSINDQTNGKEILSLKRDGGREYFGQYAEHRYLFGQKNWESLKSIREYKEAKGNEARMNNNWQPFYYQSQPSQNYQVSVGRVWSVSKNQERKLGLIASAGYRNTQTIQALRSARYGFGENWKDEKYLIGHQYGFATTLSGILGIGFTDSRHKISLQHLFTQVLDQQMNYGRGWHTVMEEDSRAMIEKVLQTNLWQSQLRGEHSLGGKIKLAWSGNYTRIRRVAPDNHIITWKSVPDSFHLPHNDFNVSQLYSEGLSSGALRMYSHAQENNFNWDLNIRVPFSIGKTSHSFKTGYAGWNKSRQFWVALIGDMPGKASDLKIYLPKMFTKEYGGDSSYISQFGEDYDKSATLHAAYGMFDSRIGKLRIVWGVRGEYFDIDRINQGIEKIVNDLNRYRPAGEELDFSVLYNREKKLNLFPSINLTYNITPAIAVRAAWSKSIIRPDLREMSYLREYDFELGGEYSAGILRSTMLNNYDFRVEWYPGAEEIVSASAFYKDLDYPMEIIGVSGVSGNAFRLENNKKGKTYGIEMEVRKSLSFIQLPVIRDLTVYGNFTALTNKVTPMATTYSIRNKVVEAKDTIFQEYKRPLVGQSNYILNAGLYYESKKLNISLNYNAVSNRTAVTYGGGPLSMLYSYFERPMRSLDGQIAYRFLKQRLEVRLNISNLLDERNLVYQNWGATPEQVEEAKQGNYNTKFLLYDKSVDRIMQSLSPGRTYAINFSYQF